MKSTSLLIKIPIALISSYQLILSPILPKTCRFYPTCSEYAKQALLKYGLIKGSVLTIKRILRCNPLNHGGYDPVD
ncbi:MAG: membrane protein insertion efficiency factor YidD [candidate division WOR-3 bacterium]